MKPDTPEVNWSLEYCESIPCPRFISLVLWLTLSLSLKYETQACTAPAASKNVVCNDTGRLCQQESQPSQTHLHFEPYLRLLNFSSYYTSRSPVLVATEQPSVVSLVAACSRACCSMQHWLWDRHSQFNLKTLPFNLYTRFVALLFRGTLFCSLRLIDHPAQFLTGISVKNHDLTGW